MARAIIPNRPDLDLRGKTLIDADVTTSRGTGFPASPEENQLFILTAEVGSGDTLMVPGFYQYDGAAWRPVASGAGGSSFDLISEDTSTSTVTVDGNLIVENNLHVGDISANDDEQQFDVSEDVVDYAISITPGPVGTGSIINLSTTDGRAVQNALNSTGGTNLKLYVAAQNDDIIQSQVVTSAIEGPFLTVFSITEGANPALSSITFEETVEDDDTVFGTGNLVTYTWFLAELRSENSILVRSNVIFEGDVSGIINRPERYSYASEDTVDWDEVPSTYQNTDAAYDDPFHTDRESYRGHIVLINDISFEDVDVSDSATSHTIFSLPEATVVRMLEADPNTPNGTKRVGLHGVDEPGRALGAVTPNQFVNRATSDGGLLYDPANVAGPGGSNATVDASGNTQVRIKIFYRVRDNANEVIGINATSDFVADFFDQGNRAQIAEITDIIRADEIARIEENPLGITSNWVQSPGEAVSFENLLTETIFGVDGFPTSAGEAFIANIDEVFTRLDFSSWSQFAYSLNYAAASSGVTNPTQTQLDGFQEEAIDAASGASNARQVLIEGVQEQILLDWITSDQAEGYVQIVPSEGSPAKIVARVNEADTLILRTNVGGDETNLRDDLGGFGSGTGGELWDVVLDLAWASETTVADGVVTQIFSTGAVTNLRVSYDRLRSTVAELADVRPSGFGGSVAIISDNSSENNVPVPAGGIAIIGPENQYYNVSGSAITVGALASFAAALTYFETTNINSWVRVGDGFNIAAIDGNGSNLDVTSTNTDANPLVTGAFYNSRTGIIDVPGGSSQTVHDAFQYSFNSASGSTTISGTFDNGATLPTSYTFHTNIRLITYSGAVGGNLHVDWVDQDGDTIFTRTISISDVEEAGGIYLNETIAVADLTNSPTAGGTSTVRVRHTGYTGANFTLYLEARLDDNGGVAITGHTQAYIDSTLGTHQEVANAALLDFITIPESNAEVTIPIGGVGKIEDEIVWYYNGTGSSQAVTHQGSFPTADGWIRYTDIRDVGSNITVDQTYDGASANAQSGVALAPEFDSIENEINHTSTGVEHITDLSDIESVQVFEDENLPIDNFDWIQTNQTLIDGSFGVQLRKSNSRVMVATRISEDILPGHIIHMKPSDVAITGNLNIDGNNSIGSFVVTQNSRSEEQGLEEENFTNENSSLVFAIVNNREVIVSGIPTENFPVVRINEFFINSSTRLVNTNHTNLTNNADGTLTIAGLIVDVPAVPHTAYTLDFTYDSGDRILEGTASQVLVDNLIQLRTDERLGTQETNTVSVTGISSTSGTIVLTVDDSDGVQTRATGTIVDNTNGNVTFTVVDIISDTAIEVALDADLTTIDTQDVVFTNLDPTTLTDGFTDSPTQGFVIDRYYAYDARLFDPSDIVTEETFIYYTNGFVGDLSDREDVNSYTRKQYVDHEVDVLNNRIDGLDAHFAQVQRIWEVEGNTFIRENSLGPVSGRLLWQTEVDSDSEISIVLDNPLVTTDDATSSITTVNQAGNFTFTLDGTLATIGGLNAFGTYSIDITLQRVREGSTTTVETLSNISLRADSSTAFSRRHVNHNVSLDVLSGDQYFWQWVVSGSADLVGQNLNRLFINFENADWRITILDDDAIQLTGQGAESIIDQSDDTTELRAWTGTLAEYTAIAAVSDPAGTPDTGDANYDPNFLTTLYDVTDDVVTAGSANLTDNRIPDTTTNGNYPVYISGSGQLGQRTTAQVVSDLGITPTTPQAWRGHNGTAFVEDANPTTSQNLGINLTETIDLNSLAVSTTADSVTIPAGTYEIITSIAFTQPGNPGVRTFFRVGFSMNGGNNIWSGYSGYARESSTNVGSGVQHTDIIQITGNTAIRLNYSLLAEAVGGVGSFEFEVGSCVLLIKKIA